jgi:hypothetical protein
VRPVSDPARVPGGLAKPHTWVPRNSVILEAYAG